MVTVTSRDNCTLCGGPREIYKGMIDNDLHFETERHREAVRAWDEKHVGRLALARVRTHHDWHVALKIKCGCDG